MRERLHGQVDEKLSGNGERVGEWVGVWRKSGRKCRGVWREGKVVGREIVRRWNWRRNRHGRVAEEKSVERDGILEREGERKWRKTERKG